MTLLQNARLPLSYRNFRYLFAAQAISLIGTGLSPVAWALGVLELTKSNTDLGITLGAASIPTVVMLLIGGVWADRLPRHQVVAVANIACCVTQLALGCMLLLGKFSLLLAIALQLVFGIARAFYFPASTGLTADAAPPEALQPANALLSFARSATGVIGPLLAGLLVVTVGAGWALVIDGLSYVISALLIANLQLNDRTRAAGDESFLRQLAAGFREVVNRSWVWTSIVVFMFIQLGAAVLLVLGPGLALRRSHGVAVWSAIVACISLGSLLGDVAALRFRPSRLIANSRIAALFGIPVFIVLALNVSLPLLLISAVLSGFAASYPDSLWFTALQQHLEPQTLSRVSSYDWMGSLALRPLGLMVAPWLASAFGSPFVMVMIAALLAGSGVLGLLFKGVWTLRAVTSEARDTGLASVSQ